MNKLLFKMAIFFTLVLAPNLCFSGSRNTGDYTPRYQKSRYSLDILDKYVTTGDLDPIEGVWSYSFNFSDEVIIEGERQNNFNSAKDCDEFYIVKSDLSTSGTYLLIHKKRLDLIKGAKYLSPGDISATIKPDVINQNSYYFFFDMGIQKLGSRQVRMNMINDEITGVDNQTADQPGWGIKMTIQHDYLYRRISKRANAERDIQTGTGFLISLDGYIATNLHVVQDTKNIVLLCNDTKRTTLPAFIEITDSKNDICILRVPELKRHISSIRIPYGFDDSINKTGESVFCMGYPLTEVMGNEVKVTNGIISSVTGYQGDVTSYQFSAPAQPGNSGGPLFNSSGNVIGIVNSKISQAENVSYAVKISYLKNLVGLLEENIVLEKKNQASTNLSSMVENFKSAVFIIEAEY